LVFAILTTCPSVPAQKPSPKTAPITPAPDLSKLTIEKILQQLQATKVPQSFCSYSPLRSPNWSNCSRRVRRRWFRSSKLLSL
jgi:hypothetical protein